MLETPVEDLAVENSSSSNWILMSCQPHRVTSGHKQIHISKLFSHIYQPSVKSVYKTNHFANIKQNIHTQTSDTNFRRVSPFSITPVKRTHKARTCWHRRPFRLIYRHQVKEKYSVLLYVGKHMSQYIVVPDSRA